MKKTFFVLLFSVIFSSLFAQNKTLVTREYFEYDNIKHLEIYMKTEQLEVKKYTGEDILVEVYSNNSKTCPSFSTADQTLTITSCKADFSYPIYCKVEVYVPVNFIPETITIENTKGDSELKLLKAKDDFNFTTETGKVIFNSISSQQFNIKSVTSDINYKNLSCNSFYISTVSGNIDISLSSNVILSKIQSDSGNIKFTYDKKSNLEFLIYSEKPLTRNQNSYKTNLYYNPAQDASFMISGDSVTLDTKKGSVELIAK